MIEHCTFCNKRVWPWQAKIRAWCDHFLCVFEARLHLFPKIINLEAALLDRNKVIIYQRDKINKAFKRINAIERVISSWAQGFTIPREAEKWED